MRNFKFESIFLLSPTEKRAAKATFHQGTNLIMGPNHTGKSSLIKSLYIALGVKPKGDLGNWDKLTASYVTFNIDGKKYSVVQQQGHRALFSGDGKLIFCSANSADWGLCFSNTVGFNLTLTDKDGNIVLADARAFFLPFYINQDGSWYSDWDTFPATQQYKSPAQSILDYFTGVRPPLYYELSAVRSTVKAALSDLQSERRIISQVRKRFDQTLSLSGPKTMPALFEQDVARLSEEITSLNAEQEEIRDKQVREQEAAENLTLQIKLAKHTLEIYENDANFLQTEPHPSLFCPTCGAEHHKSFIDMLTYAEDARVLRQFTIQLADDAKKANVALMETKARLRELDERYHRVSHILETRRGDLKLDDVVKSMGAEVAFSAFEGELEALKAQIDKKLSDIERLDGQLDELTSAKRTKAILKSFRDHLSQSRIELNLPTIETKRLKLTSRPNVSGSAGPRSILAYYTAIWKATLGDYGSFSIPLVIDSLQQQGQDKDNLPKMIEHVANNLPDDSQVILAIETETDEIFDKSILLSEQYRLLSDELFDEVNAIVAPRLDEMHKTLLGRAG